MAKLSVLCLLVLCCLVHAIPAISEQVLVPAASLDTAPYAEWAHHHWVWLSHSESTRNTSEALVDSYFSHDIRVGAVDLDSDWSTGFNNFVFDEQKYPKPSEMISNWHARGVRVILWATSMINTDCDIFQEAKNKSYFIRDAFNKEMKPIKWWHGHGCLIDYTNPEGLEWWHKQMDKVLDLGIDGWKCDGTDPFILELVYPRGYKGRHVSYTDYAHAYYHDFLNYSRQRLGQDRLIMSRPVDSYGPIFLSFSPKDVMFSGWTGDLDPTWAGYKTGLERMRSSSRRGYLNFGTDIGGYRGCGGGACRDRDLFMRWFQLGAFCPLMENGGNDDHTPWAYDQHYFPGQTIFTDTYRTYVNAHYALVPYLLSTATERYKDQRSTMEFLSILPNDFRYLLGDNILVAPPLSNVTSMEIHFPDGEDWQDFWNHNISYKGGSKVNYDCPLTKLPVFQRGGSIIPLSAADADDSCPKNAENRDIIARVALTRMEDAEVIQNVHEFEGKGLILSYKSSAASRSVIVSASASSRRVTFQFRAVSRPKTVLNHEQMAITERSSSVNAGCSEASDSDSASAWWAFAEGVLTLHLGNGQNGAIAHVAF